MTPRSGSTLLARQLSALDIGHPQEFLNEGFIANFDLLFPPPSLSDFEHFIVSSYTSKNGIFGLKADYHRFAHSRRIGYMSSLYDDVDIYVYLRRNDFVSQAISLAIAAQTGIWEELSSRFIDVDEVYRNLVYRVEDIIESIINIMEQEYHWREFLEQEDKPVLSFSYEELVVGLDQTVRRIGAELGVEIGDRRQASTASVIKPVPSRINSEWKLRFLGRNQALVAKWTRQRGLERAS